MLVVNKEQERFKILLSNLNKLLVHHKPKKFNKNESIKVSKADASLIERFIGEPIEQQNFWGYPILVKTKGAPEIT